MLLLQAQPLQQALDGNMKMLYFFIALSTLTSIQLNAMQETVCEEQIFDEFNYFDSIASMGLFRNPKLLAGIKARHIPTRRTYSVYWNNKLDKPQGYYQEENEFNTCKLLNNIDAKIFFEKLWNAYGSGAEAPTYKKHLLDALHKLTQQ